MARRTLKAKDIERLENTSPLGGPQALTTATTFCCPTERGSICDGFTYTGFC